MFRSGQIVYDKIIQEPVIFIEGDGKYSDVVCTGVEDIVSSCQTSDIIPIWDASDRVLIGKMAAKNFATIIVVTKVNYQRFSKYIHDINAELSNDGKIKELRYHTK